MKVLPMLPRFIPSAQRALCIRSLDVLPAALLFILAGCSTSPLNIGIGVTPATTTVLDAGQSLVMQATVTGDFNNRGITWTVNGAGQLSGAALQPVPANSGKIVSNNTYLAPTAVVSSSTVTVVASAAADSSKTATVTIMLNPMLAISSPSSGLPGGTVGAAYSSPTLVVAGGGSGIVYTVTSGTLPAGLTLAASTGVLSGTPTLAGTFNFNVTATDLAGSTVTQNFAITITSNIAITTASPLPAGFVNTAYNQQFTTAGGSGYLYTLVQGTLPGGLNLTASGVLSGTPSAAGTTSFTLKVTDSAGNTTTKAFTLSITVATLAVTPMMLPSANTGNAYSQQLSYTGVGRSPGKEAYKRRLLVLR